MNEYLQRLRTKEEGITRPITNSKYANLIVPVVKPNGKIRLFAYFKVTFNTFLHVEKHLLRKLNDTLTTLDGGLHFTKIDFNQARL